MKLTMILLLYGILLLNIICSSTAEDCDPVLNITKISHSSITVSWDKDSFSGDGFYDIELSSDEPCEKIAYPCEGSICQVDNRKMNCPRDQIPCSDVTYNITGNSNKCTESITTKTAPYFRKSDWNLTATIDGNNLAVVTWGPPQSSSDVSCATNATVSASCNDQNDDTTMADISSIDLQGSAEFTINNCMGENVTITVTYMSGDIPTETKKSITVKADNPVTIKPEEPPLSGWEIAGIVIGSLIGVGLLVGGGIFAYKKKWHCCK